MMWEKVKEYFEFEKRQTTARAEVVGGVTTFMTMAYIIFVNPTILAKAGMDFNAVMMATCLSAAIATLIMAVVARYPIALAPGMGMNAFFTFEIVMGYGASWRTALGMVFLSGILFLLLTFAHFREVLINAIPDSLKFAMAAGIGLFIAFIGLQHAGLVVRDDATLVRMGNVADPRTLISITALAVIALMLAARVRGAILIGIVVAGALGLSAGAITVPEDFHLLSLAPSIAPTAFQFELAPIFKSWELIALVFVLLFFDLFDTMGTLIGVSEQAGFIGPDGKLPRANRALMADAIGTVTGAALGTSTVTSYIESASGVAAGARTGLAGIVTAALFLLAVFFAPTVKLLAEPFVTAPALIAVGCMMMAGAAKINWKNYEDAIPAFLTMIIMPLAFSISRGMVAGLISWPVLMLASGKGRKVHPVLYGLAAVLVAGVIVNYSIFRAPDATPPVVKQTPPPVETPPPAETPRVIEPPAVTFMDCKLEAAVRAAVPKPTGDLHEADFDRLYKLEAQNLGIVSLEGIQHCTRLETLELAGNLISDLTPLQSLYALQSLGLDNNRINDLGPLQNLQALRRLWASRNSIYDLSPLAVMPGLLDLNLSRNGISDLGPLAKLVQLHNLNLSQNQISDLSPLAGVTQLLAFDVSSNQVSDLGALAGFSAVSTLELWSNQITDVAPLIECQKAGGLPVASHLRIFKNPLSEKAKGEQLPYLQQHGVMVQQ